MKKLLPALATAFGLAKKDKPKMSKPKLVAQANLGGYGCTISERKGSKFIPKFEIIGWDTENHFPKRQARATTLASALLTSGALTEHQIETGQAQENRHSFNYAKSDIIADYDIFMTDNEAGTSVKIASLDFPKKETLNKKAVEKILENLTSFLDSLANQQEIVQALSQGKSPTLPPPAFQPH